MGFQHIDGKIDMLSKKGVEKDILVLKPLFRSFIFKFNFSFISSCFPSRKLIGTKLFHRLRVSLGVFLLNAEAQNFQISTVFKQEISKFLNVIFPIKNWPRIKIIIKYCAPCMMYEST